MKCFCRQGGLSFFRSVVLEKQRYIIFLVFTNGIGYGIMKTKRERDLRDGEIDGRNRNGIRQKRK